MIKKSIPSFITSLNLACGVLAIITSDLRTGVFLIFLAAIFDVFDGGAARILNAMSPLGKELDSLADIVSFGVAPAIVYYKAIGIENNLIYLAPIFISIGGALRLARFNVKSTSEKYFEGMAIPATGLFICGIVIAIYYSEPIIIKLFSIDFIVVSFGMLMAILNISNLKMFSLKQLGTVKIVKFYFISLIITGILLSLFLPLLAIPLVLTMYILLSVLDHYVLRSY